MPNYLLAAEADQIQDFLFRASRLREVVGGSQLLSRFCREGAAELLQQHGGDPSRDIIINDGGAFRIVLQGDDAEVVWRQAQSFGDDLAELYRRCAGGNLTVAEPIELNGGFQESAKRAQEALHDAKNRGDVAAAAVHMPYVAFCASCGVAVATEHRRRPGDERANYCCAFCRQKALERDRQERSDFLGSFQEAVAEACRADGREDIPSNFPEDTDKVASFDLTRRRYVAYLLADGNGMGKQFSACPNEQTMRGLSKALSRVLRNSLAAPCPHLLRRIQRQNENGILPVLPLILGGDDLFALLPASWAIDFSARFCLEYEKRMTAALHELNVPVGEGGPTIAVVVVICKGNYPYALAHRQGEQLLKEAKQLARGLEAHPDSAKKARVSVLDFVFITGNEIASYPFDGGSKLRPTARPYFVRADVSVAAGEAGLPIQTLIEHRLLLTRLPGKRRAELEALYQEATLLERHELGLRWKPRLDTLLRRIGRGSTELKETVEATLRELGDPDQGSMGYWRFFDRLFEPGFHHGLGDLLAVWDYAYDVTKEQSDYGE